MSRFPDDDIEPTPRETAELTERLTARLYGALCALVSDLARDYEHCGKAACARSRRCRGFACEPEVESREQRTPAGAERRPGSAALPPGPGFR